MNIFKTFTLKWWQTGFFKLGMLTLGIAIGTHWHGLFGGGLVILTIVAAVSLAYISYAWWKQ
jgi:dolichyl-phosphate-mannose--protein O-mannosyl transferase